MSEPKTDGRDIFVAEDPTGRTETTGKDCAAAEVPELGTTDVVVAVGQILAVTVWTLW